MQRLFWSLPAASPSPPTLLLSPSFLPTRVSPPRPGCDALVGALTHSMQRMTRWTRLRRAPQTAIGMLPGSGHGESSRDMIKKRRIRAKGWRRDSAPLALGEEKKRTWRTSCVMLDCWAAGSRPRNEGRVCGLPVEPRCSARRRQDTVESGARGGHKEVVRAVVAAASAAAATAYNGGGSVRAKRPRLQENLNRNSLL